MANIGVYGGSLRRAYFIPEFSDCDEMWEGTTGVAERHHFTVKEVEMPNGFGTLIALNGAACEGFRTFCIRARDMGYTSTEIAFMWACFHNYGRFYRP